MKARPSNSTTGQLSRILLLLLCLCALPLAQAQDSSPTPSTAPPPAPAASKPAAAPAAASAPAQEAESPQPHPDPAKTTVEEGNKQAWQMLRDAAADGKPDRRIQALAALGTMGGSVEARKMVGAAFADGDRDVRLAAVLASQAMKDRGMIPMLRKALDDNAPEVSFAAAVALWRMGDLAGKDLLFDVMDGERKAGPGFIASNLHTANKDMHSPATLATMGAKQGAYMLLGPFGVGLDAYDYIHKGTSGNPSRVLAVTLLSEKKNDLTRNQLLAALGDKDAFVRTAAARALGDYHTKKVEDALLDSFGDAKLGVRLIAAASYIRATGHARGAATGPAASSAAKPAAKSAN